MQNEEQPQEQSPVEEPAPPPTKEVDKSLCEPVAAGGTCANCGWVFGQLDPHPVAIMPENVHVPVEGTPAPPPVPLPPAPDPNACAPVAHGATCSKCGWNSNDPDPAVAYKPHPIV